MNPPGPRLALPLLLLAVALAYWGIWTAGFVWDDAGLVLQNRLTGDLSNLPRFFAMDLWDGSPVDQGVSGYYRPLMLVSLALDRALVGFEPGFYHLHSLAWHLLAVAGAYALTRPALGWRGALVVAGLFGLHPVQSEAVIWVAGRNDPMAAALGLWALHAVAWVPPGRRQQATALVLTALAGFAKESVVLLPAMLLAVDAVAARRPDWRRHLPVLAGIGLVIGARALAGVGGATWPPDIGWRLLLARTPELLALVGRLLVLPTGLTAGHALEWLDRMPPGQRLLGLGGLVLWGLAVWVGWRRSGRVALLGPAWTLLSLAPLVLPLADKGLFGERYLYLSLLGVGFTLATALRGKELVLLLLAPLAVAGVQRRLPDWQDEARLWEQAVAATPTPYTWSGLGHIRRSRGQDAEALSLFVAALDDRLPDRTVCPQVVGTALAMGRPALAAQLGAWAAQKGCDSGAFQGQYAVALGFVGEWEILADRLSTTVEDPHGRLDVARGALRLHQGLDVGLDEQSQNGGSGPSLAEQARRIVAAAPR